MSLKEVSIAVAQVEQYDIPRQNLELMISVIDTVQTDLVVFPETQLSGLDTQTDLTPCHRALAKKAKKNKIWIAYGAYRRKDNRTFNSDFLINPRGELVLVYNKKHLWNEPDITPGTDSPVANTEIGNIGFITCWDIAHPSSVRDLSKKGVELVLCPSYWFGKQFGTTQVIEGLPLSRAFENIIYIAYCDAYTTDGSTAARSKICSPLEVLAYAKPQTREIISATIDLSKLTEWKQKFNCWESI